MAKVALPKACMGFRTDHAVYDAPSPGGTVEVPDSVAHTLSHRPDIEVGRPNGLGVTFEQFPDNSCLACNFNNMPWRATCARCGSLTEHGADALEQPATPVAIAESVCLECGQTFSANDPELACPRCRRAGNPHYDHAPREVSE